MEDDNFYEFTYFGKGQLESLSYDEPKPLLRRTHASPVIIETNSIQLALGMNYYQCRSDSDLPEPTRDREANYPDNSMDPETIKFYATRFIQYAEHSLIYSNYLGSKIYDTRYIEGLVKELLMNYYVSGTKMVRQRPPTRVT